MKPSVAMLKFAKSVPYLPDPIRSRPFITAADKKNAAKDPPAAVPFHCKPWTDGQTVGWTLFYGYMTAVTIVGVGGGQIEVENLEQLARETNQPRIIDQFAANHFGIGCGYTIQTPPGIVTLLLPATHAPQYLNALTGIIETDWYPRQLFLVFPTPATGTSIHLDYKTELARVVLIPRHEQLEAQPMNEAELAQIQSQAEQYTQEEATTDSKWTADSGDSFTHLYKMWSRTYRRQLK